MNLLSAKINKKYHITSVETKDCKTQIRLMELGLVPGIEIIVKRMSLKKQTILIVFKSACFTLNGNLAKCVEIR